LRRRKHAAANRQRYNQLRQEHVLRNGDPANRWQKRNKQKKAAHDAVYYAIKTGKLAKESCAHCGSNEQVQAHHENYSNPLAVTWVCIPCHSALHVNKREQELLP
jgi:ribosomal protein S27AE